MVTRRSLSLLLSLGLCGSGCGVAAVRAENETLHHEITRLRAERRRHRAELRDQQNRIFVLEDRVGRAERSEVPSLPVVRRGPPSRDDDAASAVVGFAAEEFPRESGSEADGYRVVGVDPDGVPIVYVGDAIADRSVQPSAELLKEIEDEHRQRPEGAGPRLSIDARADTPPVPREATRLAPPPERPAARPPSAPDAGDDNAKSAYQRAYAQLRRGEHSQAIRAFRAFIKRHPRHDLADNAQYWLGEAHYDLREFDKALEIFRQLLERYPRGNKLPDALLKIGFCHRALRHEARARKALQHLVTQYPKSPAAVIARERLAQSARDPS